MDEHMKPVDSPLTRRAVLQRTSLLLAGAAGVACSGCTQLQGHGQQAPRPLRIGLVTDVHYADKDDAKSRHYRASLGKLSAAVKDFNEKRADVVVQLGDLIDAAPTAEQELTWLDRIRSVYEQANCTRCHVLGNHCVQTLTKEQFLARSGIRSSFYSFDAQGFHLVVLDGCFRQDGQAYRAGNFKWTDANIPSSELDWLKADLEKARQPAVVFLHQRLDVDDAHGIHNRAEVRSLLEASGRVWAVFQGHNHLNDLRPINGIAYFTLAAMVEGDTNAYGLATLDPRGTIHIEGYGRQSSWEWKREERKDEEMR